MNPVKMERQKPDIILYRPGMGLRNKNRKIEECEIKSEYLSPDIVNLDLSVSANVGVSNDRKSNELNLDSQKPKKIKSRRPSAEIYVSKARVAYLKEQKLETLKQKPSATKQIGVSRRQNWSNRYFQHDDRTMSFEKEDEKEIFKKCIPSKCINSSSPLTTSSGGDLMDEYDLSNSRSTSGDVVETEELCSDSLDSLSSVYKAKYQRNVNHAEETKTSSNRRNCPRQEALASSQKGSSNSKAEKETFKKCIPSKSLNSSSPLKTRSWADIMDEYDLSNSRSTSGDVVETEELCSDSLDSLSSVCKAKDQRNVNHAEETETSSNRRNCPRQEALAYSQKGGSNSKSKNAYGLRNKSLEDESRQHKKADRGKVFNSSRIYSGKSATNELIVKKVEIKKSNQETFNRDSIKKSDVRHRSRGSNSTVDNKASLDRMKIEQTETCITARYQKNKASILDNNHSAIVNPFGNGNGGILKLPDHFEKPDPQSEVLKNAMYAPSVFQEPQTFIRKQLSDPNGPSISEIINKPAPASHPVIQFPNRSPPNYSTDFGQSYLFAPVPNLGYIPPPHPAAMHQQYSYMQPDDDVHNSYAGPRENGGGPIQCLPSVAFLDVGFSRSLCLSEVPAVAPEPQKQGLKRIVKKNLHDIVLHEKTLTELLAKGFNIGDINSISLKQCRWNLLLKYESIILADPKYCAEKNPEQSLWKIVFHMIIEIIIKKLEDNAEDEEKLKDFLLNLISEGSVFFENLLEKQEETHDFKLIKVLELEITSSACVPEHLRCVLISVQKILIYLGDLSRYKEQVCKTTNLGKARSWYLKAQQIAQKTGSPRGQ